MAYSQPSNEQTTFNMSLAILKRIDLLLTDIAMASKQRDLHQWFDLLETLKREVDFMYNDLEKKMLNIYLKELIQLDNDYLNCKRISQFKDYSIFHKLLESYGRFLKNSLYTRGMLVVHKSDVGSAILNMG